MEYYSAFLLQLNMEPCFSADTPPLSGIFIKQLSPHLYMALFPQITITPLSGTYSFFTIPPLYDTISFLYSPRILPHLYLWLYCCICPHLYLALFPHLTLAPAPRRVFFTPTFTCNLYSPSASILFHLNVTLPQGFSAEYFSPP